mmetsp:Transcript_44596/g.88134  ORF Transcript_44596/g.88134 Transcript_44596/m.88134 type:complete len:169 (+) Transcript_44596:478-984(+)
MQKQTKATNPNATPPSLREFRAPPFLLPFLSEELFFLHTHPSAPCLPARLPSRLQAVNFLSLRKRERKVEMKKANTRKLIAVYPPFLSGKLLVSISLLRNPPILSSPLLCSFILQSIKNRKKEAKKVFIQRGKKEDHLGQTGRQDGVGCSLMLFLSFLFSSFTQPPSP